MFENSNYFTEHLTLLIYVEDYNDKIINYLSSFFHEILIASNEKDAFTKFNNNHIDIIMIDIGELHNVNSKFTFMDNLKRVRPSLITLVLSSQHSFETAHKAIEYGVDDYILEPINENYFQKVLKKIEKKYLEIEEYEDIKHNINLLRQYQDITDKSTIISKTDPSGKITYANDNFCQVSGYSKNELIGKNHNLIRHPDNSKAIYKEMWDVIKNQKKQWNGIVKNISKNGKAYYVKSTINPILDENEEILEYIALRDNISSIMSDKKHFLDNIESNILSLLILVQIEEFDMLEKFYNLTTVDQIEKMFGYKLLSYLPTQYKFENVYNLDNGRYGLLTDFDKFLASNVKTEDYLKEFVENVKRSVLEIDGIEYDINITLSYSYGKHMLYEDAKSGLEEAIEKKLIICHSNDFSIYHQREARKNLEVIKMVKIALENYNIISYFQPIINNKTKEVEKYESLVRLIDEEGNVLSPFTFLNISKKGNYYNKITHRVLENSFKMLKSITTKLSINLSALDIEKEETRNIIYGLLEEYKYDRNRLVFELLEDEDVKDFDSIKRFIRTVKPMGILIAIDDFGAGYSNFERLLDFEPDILKIDGSLIRNILNDKYNKNVVETIVEFAKKQNIKTIAEYVENEEIFNLLNDLGVDYSQGYYFGKPENLSLI